MIEQLEKNLRKLLNSKKRKIKKVIRYERNGKIIRYIRKRKSKIVYTKDMQKKFDGLIRELKTYGWIGGDLRYFYSFLRIKDWNHRRRLSWRLLRHSKELTKVIDSRAYYKANFVLNEVLSNPIDTDKIKIEKPLRIPVEIPNHPISKSLERRIKNKIAVYHYR